MSGSKFRQIRQLQERWGDGQVCAHKCQADASCIQHHFLSSISFIGLICRHENGLHGSFYLTLLGKNLRFWFLWKAKDKLKPSNQFQAAHSNLAVSIPRWLSWISSQQVHFGQKHTQTSAPWHFCTWPTALNIEIKDQISLFSGWFSSAFGHCFSFLHAASPVSLQCLIISHVFSVCSPFYIKKDN